MQKESRKYQYIFAFFRDIFRGHICLFQGHFSGTYLPFSGTCSLRRIERYQILNPSLGMLSQGFNLSPPHPTEFAVYFCKILSFQQNFRNFFKMFSHFCRETSLFVCKIFAFLYFTRVNEMRKKLNIYETIYLETLVWKTQYGNPSMETLIWKSQYGNLNMEILVWKPSY